MHLPFFCTFLESLATARKAEQRVRAVERSTNDAAGIDIARYAGRFSSTGYLPPTGIR